MRRLIAVLTVIVFSVMVSFAQTDYVQVEVMNVTPKADKMDLFKKGMAAHNKKFHAAGPYNVSVSYTVSGPGSGSYTWVMGPTTWAQMDTRPAKGEHDTDWEKNVVPYCESFGPGSYWRLNKDASYQPEGNPNLPKGRIRYNYILPGQMDRYIEQMKKVAEVYKKKKYTRSFALWVHYGAAKGADAVTINSYANWAALDSGSGFVKDYEEVHGEGSFTRFLDEMALSVDRSKNYDELSEDVPELGG